MTDNTITLVEARDLPSDKYTVILTYEDGSQTGHLTTHARLLEMIDGFEEQ